MLGVMEEPCAGSQHCFVIFVEGDSHSQTRGKTVHLPRAGDFQAVIKVIAQTVVDSQPGQDAPAILSEHAEQMAAFVPLRSAYDLEELNGIGRAIRQVEGPVGNKRVPAVTEIAEVAVVADIAVGNPQLDRVRATNQREVIQRLKPALAYESVVDGRAQETARSSDFECLTRIGETEGPLAIERGAEFIRRPRIYHAGQGARYSIVRIIREPAVLDGEEAAHAGIEVTEILAIVSRIDGVLVIERPVGFDEGKFVVVSRRDEAVACYRVARRRRSAHFEW